MPRKFCELSDKKRWDRFEELVARQMGRLRSGVGMDSSPSTPDMDNTENIDHELDSSFYNSATPSSTLCRKDGLPRMAKSLITLLDITVHNLEGFQTLDDQQDTSFAENFHEIRESYKKIQKRASELKGRIERNMRSKVSSSEEDEQKVDVVPNDEIDGHNVMEEIGADLPHRAREMSERLGQMLSLHDSDVEGTQSLAREVIRVLDFVCRLSQLLQSEASWPHIKIESAKTLRLDDVNEVVAMVTHDVIGTPESSIRNREFSFHSDVSKASTNLRENLSCLSFTMSELNCSSASHLHSQHGTQNESPKPANSSQEHLANCSKEPLDVTIGFGSKQQLDKVSTNIDDFQCVQQPDDGIYPVQDDECTYLSHINLLWKQNSSHRDISLAGSGHSGNPSCREFSDENITHARESLCADICDEECHGIRDAVCKLLFEEDDSPTQNAVCIDLSHGDICNAQEASCTDVSDCESLGKEDNDSCLQDDISQTHAVCIDLSNDNIHQSHDFACTDLSVAGEYTGKDIVLGDALPDDVSKTQDAVCIHLSNEGFSNTHDAISAEESNEDCNQTHRAECLAIPDEGFTHDNASRSVQSEIQGNGDFEASGEDSTEPQDCLNIDKQLGNVSHQSDVACGQQSKDAMHDLLDSESSVMLHQSRDAHSNDLSIGAFKNENDNVNEESTNDSQAHDISTKDYISDEVSPPHSPGREQSLQDMEPQVQDCSSRDSLLCDGAIDQITDSASRDELQHSEFLVEEFQNEEEWHDAPAQISPVAEEWFDALCTEQPAKTNVYTVLNTTVASSLDHRYKITGIASALDDETIKGDDKNKAVVSREAAMKSRPYVDKPNMFSKQSTSRVEDSLIDSGILTRADSSITAPTESSLKVKSLKLSVPPKHARLGVCKSQVKISDTWLRGGRKSLTGISYHEVPAKSNSQNAKESKSDGLMTRDRRKMSDKLSINYSSVSKKMIGERATRFRSFIAKKQANYLLMTNPIMPATDNTTSELSSSPDSKASLFASSTQRRRKLNRYRPRCAGSSDNLALTRHIGRNTRPSQSPAQNRTVLWIPGSRLFRTGTSSKFTSPTRFNAPKKNRMLTGSKFDDLSPEEKSRRLSSKVNSDGYLEDDATTDETSDPRPLRRREAQVHSGWQRGATRHQRSSSVPLTIGSRRTRTPVNNPSSSAFSSYLGTSRPYLQPDESGTGQQAVLPSGSPVKVRILCKEGSSKDKNKVTSIKSGKQEIDIKRVKRSSDQNFDSAEADAVSPARLVKLTGAAPGYNIDRPNPDLIRVQMNQGIVPKDAAPSNPDAGHPSAKAVRLRLYPHAECDVYVNVHIPDGTESPKKEATPKEDTTNKKGESTKGKGQSKSVEESKKEPSASDKKPEEESTKPSKPIEPSGREPEELSTKPSKPAVSRVSEKEPKDDVKPSEDGLKKSTTPTEEPAKAGSRRTTLESLRKTLTDPLTRSSLPKDESRKASISKSRDVSIHSSREGSIRSLVEQIDDDLLGLEEKDRSRRPSKQDMDKLPTVKEEEEFAKEKVKPVEKLRKAEKKPLGEESAGDKVLAYLKDFMKLLLLLLLLWLLYCLVLMMFEPCSSCFNPLGGLIGWLSRVVNRNLRLIHMAPPPL